MRCPAYCRACRREREGNGSPGANRRQEEHASQQHRDDHRACRRGDAVAIPAHAGEVLACTQDAALCESTAPPPAAEAGLGIGLSRAQATPHAGT